MLQSRDWVPLHEGPDEWTRVRFSAPTGSLIRHLLTRAIAALTVRIQPQCVAKGA